MFGSAAGLVGASLVPPLAEAAVPLASSPGPGVYRMRLGDCQITALYDGLWPIPIDDGFIRNASTADGAGQQAQSA
jgi:hypothetical protein